MVPRTPWFSVLALTIGCSSPSEPPVAQIPVSEALAVVDPLESPGLACGVMKWNGKGYGATTNMYLDVKTPWKSRTADSLSYTYAEAEGKRILVSVNIDGHEYARDDSSHTQLTWRRYLRE